MAGGRAGCEQGRLCAQAVAGNNGLIHRRHWRASQSLVAAARWPQNERQQLQTAVAPRQNGSSSASRPSAHFALPGHSDNAWRCGSPARSQVMSTVHTTPLCPSKLPARTPLSVHHRLILLSCSVNMKGRSVRVQVADQQSERRNVHWATPTEPCDAKPLHAPCRQ